MNSTDTIAKTSRGIAEVWPSLCRYLKKAEFGKLCLEEPLDNRTMAVMFCDISGSTQALRRLESDEFRRLQQRLFGKICDFAKELEGEKGRIVVDKFMGDGGMFYSDCGNLTEVDYPVRQKKISGAATQIMCFVDKIVGEFEALRTGGDDLGTLLRKKQVTLGARFGLALGDSIVLSLLGNRGAGLSLTLTGETVNLAARLEQAKAPEFLECIGGVRQELEHYASRLSLREKLHGTSLAKKLAECDREVLDLHAVCKCRYQVRADENFVRALDESPEDQLERAPVAWRPVSFAPRGFGDVRRAWLLGGDSSSELFQMV